MRQDELAGKIGLSRPSLSNIERGAQVVTLDTINRISQAFGKTTFEFLYAALPIVSRPVRKNHDHPRTEEA